MAKILDLPAVADVLKMYPAARQTFIVCESIGDFIATTQDYGQHPDGGSWVGNMSKTECIRSLREGNEEGAKIAEALLSKIEQVHFETHSWRVVNDVVGGVANIPAYLAGVPLNMRRRQRLTSEMAPLAIMVDLTSSAGIDASDVQKRGAAVLALLRLLSNVRAVELWAIVGLGKSNYAAEICTRLDTAPLDLGRAGHMLTHPSVSRGLGYGYLESRHKSGGGWNFGNIDLQRKTARESLKRVLPANPDVLYIPPIYLKDDSIKNPTKWLNDMLKVYGGINQDAA